MKMDVLECLLIILDKLTLDTGIYIYDVLIHNNNK